MPCEPLQELQQRYGKVFNINPFKCINKTEHQSQRINDMLPFFHPDSMASIASLACERSIAAWNCNCCTSGLCFCPGKRYKPCAETIMKGCWIHTNTFESPSLVVYSVMRVSKDFSLVHIVLSCTNENLAAAAAPSGSFTAPVIAWSSKHWVTKHLALNQAVLVCSL